MGLGTTYPASTGGKPPTGTGDRVPPGTPPQTGSRQYSQNYPQNNPSWYEEGNVTPSSITQPMDPLLAQFQAIQAGQRDQLQSQYLNAIGMGELGYDNEMWYRNASAASDLAKLANREAQQVGLGRERNDADRGFAGRGFEIDSRGNALKRDMGYRANDSEAASRGSISSFGYGQNARDILAQFGINQDTTQLSYDKKMSDLNIDDKALDLMAKDFGLQRDDVNNALKYASTQLGMDWITTVQGLNSSLESGDAALRQQALNFMTSLMAMPQAAPSMTDIFPNGIPMPQGDGPLELGPASLEYLAQQQAASAVNGAGGAGGNGGGGGGGVQRAYTM